MFQTYSWILLFVVGWRLIYGSFYSTLFCLKKLRAAQANRLLKLAEKGMESVNMVIDITPIPRGLILFHELFNGLWTNVAFPSLTLTSSFIRRPSNSVNGYRRAAVYQRNQTCWVVINDERDFQILQEANPKQKTMVVYSLLTGRKILNYTLN
jgi:hypothetical protein